MCNEKNQLEIGFYAKFLELTSVMLLNWLMRVLASVFLISTWMLCIYVQRLKCTHKDLVQEGGLKRAMLFVSFTAVYLCF